MSFWEWAVAAYARPGVEAACLRLQDQQGQCVPFLLWAAWAAAEGRILAPEVLAAGADAAQVWEREVTGPLRAVRRGLKDAGSLREQVKAAELKAEQALIEALEALTPGCGGPPLKVSQALAAAGAAWSPAARADGLNALAETLG